MKAADVKVGMVVKYKNGRGTHYVRIASMADRQGAVMLHNGPDEWGYVEELLPLTVRERGGK